MLSGNVTVPVADGFKVLLRKKSGSTRTITPAGGSIVYQGLPVASLTLPHLREMSLWSDGTTFGRPGRSTDSELEPP